MITPSVPTTRSPLGRDLVLLASIFLLSRLIYIFYFHVQFYTASLYSFLQFLDPELLRHDLLRNLWYFHSQPPLFNLFLGVILKLFPVAYPLIFQFLYILLGLAFALVLFGLMIKIGVSRKIALTLTALFAVAPSTVLNEHLLFYTYPIAFLLCAAALCLACFLESFKARWAFLFFSALALASFIHAVFGHLFLLLVFASLFYLLKGRRLLLLRTAAVPFFFVALLAIKQFILFGTFTSGASYLGPNLASRLNLMVKIPPSVRAELVSSGQVPPYFFTYPLIPLRYFQPYRPPPAPTNIPALDAEIKSTGAINYNHKDYIVINDGYTRGAFAVFKKYPVYFLEAYKDTWPYFNPAGQGLEVTQGAQSSMVKFQHTVDMILGGQPVVDGPCIFLIIMLPSLLIFGVVKFRKTFPTRAQDPRVLLLPFLLLLIVFTSAVTLSITWADWYRYRFSVDSFYLTLLGLFLTTFRQSRQSNPAKPHIHSQTSPAPFPASTTKR